VQEEDANERENAMGDMRGQLETLVEEKSQILQQLKLKGKIEGDYEHSSAAVREKQIRIRSLERELAEK
jgi:hypothetical protein